MRDEYNPGELYFSWSMLDSRANPEPTERFSLEEIGSVYCKNEYLNERCKPELD